MAKSEEKKSSAIMQRSTVLRLILLTLIIVLLLLTFRSLFRYLVLFIFIIVNFLFALGKRLLPKAGAGKFFFGIEFVMFFTVISSISFGSNIGAVMGAILMAVNYVGEHRFSRYFPVTLILYTIVGYISYFFRNYDILILGIIITLAYNLIVTFTVSLFEANKATMVVFNITNILFNSLIFSMWGRFLLGILQ